MQSGTYTEQNNAKYSVENSLFCVFLSAEKLWVLKYCRDFCMFCGYFRRLAFVFRNIYKETVFISY